MNIKDLKLGIIGGGTVGRALFRAFNEHVKDCCVWDLLPERRTDLLVYVLNSDIIFVCLPTPQKEGSLGCDLSVIEEWFASLTTKDSKEANWVLRSTVPISTTRRLREQYGLTNLVHSPEFLTARCAVTDAHLPARNIVGMPNPGPAVTLSYPVSECFTRLMELYQQRFPGVPTLRMSSDESEATKLFTNAAFAVKVALMNELRCLSDKLGLSWETVLAGVLADGRIAHSHTKVPGPDSKFGFANGPNDCLGKDLANLIDCFYRPDARAREVFPHVLRAAHERNAVDRERVNK